jgi:hypothetical protein
VVSGQLSAAGANSEHGWPILFIAVSSRPAALPFPPVGLARHA